MNYLIDTSVFLWMIRGDNNKISRRAVKSLEGADELYLSSVSTWEIAIKYKIGKLELKNNPDRWLPELVLKMGLKQLSISQAHTLALAVLPLHHRDPFDRLLASQSKIEKLPLISPDKIFKKYNVELVW